MDASPAASCLFKFVGTACGYEYDRWFNDFLHDSEYERTLAYSRSESAVGGGDATISVWSHVQCCRERYANVLWIGKRPSSPAGVAGGTEGARVADDSGVSECPDDRRELCDTAGVDVDVGVGGVLGQANHCPPAETKGREADGKKGAPSRCGEKAWAPRLRPLCGVRSLAVWQRAWANRGLEVR